MSKSKTYIVTGGAGFIGSCLVRRLADCLDCNVVIIDNLSYSGNLSTLRDFIEKPNITFIKEDIVNQEAVTKIFSEFSPDKIFHFAAESHVDNSISSPKIFLDTNILGTFSLLQAALECYETYSPNLIFHHISTDEVYGDLNKNDDAFTENTPYNPSSPYSASKAASDHLVKAWNRTYGLPTILTNCSNNYGPYQHPEKLIPKTIINCLNHKSIPVYGNGEQIRDWLHVEDHISAILHVSNKENIGEMFNIGSRNEQSNIFVVRKICELIDKELKINNFSHLELIKFINDRPGHDQRYAIDSSKIEKYQAWQPSHGFEEGLAETVKWYIENRWWWEELDE